MKKILFLMMILVGFLNDAAGQNDNFGFVVGVGTGSIMQKSLDGGATYDLNVGFSIGFQYERKLKEKLKLQTGINWYKNSIEVTPSFYPGIDMTAKNYDIAIIYVPLFLRVDLSKRLYLNGGFIADIDITKKRYLSNQSGIGTGLGIGTELALDDKFAIKINPYLNFHSLIAFKKVNYPERLFDAGIQVSLVLK